MDMRFISEVKSMVKLGCILINIDDTTVTLRALKNFTNEMEDKSRETLKNSYGLKLIIVRE